MLNLDTVDIVYIACGVTDLRKSIDGLILEVESNLKLDPTDSESLDNLMPWSSQILEDLKIKEKK